MAKVTGIGGVFWKTRTDKEVLARWYTEHLGMSIESWGGAVLRWPDDTAEDKGVTVWSIADQGDSWFPGSLMINYRVDDLAGLLAQLQASGIEPVKPVEYTEQGGFAWIADPEGNRVELWEPKLWDEKNKR